MEKKKVSQLTYKIVGYNGKIFRNLTLEDCGALMELVISIIRNDMNIDLTFIDIVGNTLEVTIRLDRKYQELDVALEIEQAVKEYKLKTQNRIIRIKYRED